MGKVVLKRPDGSLITADAESAESLKKLGYKEETTNEAIQRGVDTANKEYYTSFGQKLQTGAEGLVSGLTLGLTDIGMQDAERKRANYNPTTRIVTEIVGAIAPAVLTGGASAEASAAKIGSKLALREAAALTPAGLVARGGRAIEGAIGGTKGAVAAGAFEGGVSGMGSAITQAAINDDPLTVESVLSSGGIGLVFGGGVGGAAERLGKVAPAVIGRTDDVAEKVAYTADDLDSFYKGLPKEKAAKEASALDEVVDVKPYNISKTTETVEETVHVPTEAFGSIKKNLGSSLSSIDDATKTVDDKLREAASNFSSLESEIGSFTQKVEGLKGINKAEFKNPYKQLQKGIKARDADLIDSALTDYVTTLETQLGKSLDPAKKQLFVDKINSFKTATNKAKELIKLKEASTLLQNFPENIDDFRKLRAAKAEKLFAALDTIEEVTNGVAIDLDTTLSHIGLSSKGSAGQKARTIWESTKTPGYFKQQEKLIEKARFSLADNVDSNVSKSELRGAFPEEKTAVGSTKKDPAEVLNAMLNPEKTGVPTLDLTPGALDFAPEMINSGAQAVNDYVSAGGRKKGINGFWKRAAESAGRRVSSSAARKLGMGALGSAVAFEAGGSATDMLLMGMFGSTVAGNREGAVSRIRSAARKAAPKVGKTLEVGRGQFGRLTTRLDGSEDKKGDVKARIEEVHNAVPLARDKAFQAVEDLSQDHPAFVKAFIDTADNFMRTLQSFMPKDPGLAFSNGKSLWEPDPVQKIQVSKVINVAHDPQGTAEYIASGNADMFTVKAFKALWPAQYGEFVVAILEAIAPKIPEMSYEEQNYYATVTGIPLHSSFTPRSMAQTQATYAAASEKARQNKAQMGSSGNGNGGRPAKTEPPTAGQSLLT